jgi:HlyD family type I secretion membrane fusion protein
MNEMTAKDKPFQIKPEAFSHGIDERPRREFATGGAIIGMFFGGLLGFGGMVPLDAGANAEGIVAVSGNRQAVQHRDGGIVTKINVTEGALVRAGDVLLMVSSPELVAAERSAAGEMISLLAMRARLKAEMVGAANFSEPVEYRYLTGDDRILADEALDDQRTLFRARRISLDSQRDVLTQRIRQNTEQINGFNHQISANREQQVLIKDEIDGLRQLLPKGFVALNRVREVERTDSELRGTYGSYVADVARAHEASGEASMQIVSLEKQQLTEAATQLHDLQVRLDDLQPKLASLREQLARSMVRAPASGRVVGLTVFTVGGVAKPGETLMEIVPQDRQLVIQGKVSPNDADDLHPGMATQVRFTGLHDRTLPILHGELTKVSADSMEDQRTGRRYFEIEVVVPKDQLALIHQAHPESAFQAGLPAEVMIPLRKRTALQYLLEPLTQSLWKAGREH